MHHSCTKAFSSGVFRKLAQLKQRESPKSFYALRALRFKNSDSLSSGSMAAKNCNRKRAGSLLRETFDKYIYTYDWMYENILFDFDR